jgi:hypothetical protein
MIRPMLAELPCQAMCAAQAPEPPAMHRAHLLRKLDAHLTSIPPSHKALLIFVVWMEDVGDVVT